MNIKVKKLHGSRVEISSEYNLERYLLKNWDIFFTMQYIGVRKKISSRSIVDILALQKKTFIILELKFRPIRPCDNRQLNRYIRDLSKQTTFKVQGMLIGYNQMTNQISVTQ